MPVARQKRWRIKPLRLFALVLPLLCLLIVPVLLISGCASSPVEAEVQADGSQTVKVLVKNGYQPSHIEAKAGTPLKIEFYRDEDPSGHSCGETLEIPAENVSLPLPSREPQIVEIKPQQAGQIEFQCGMKMMKGKITFR